MADLPVAGVEKKEVPLTVEQRLEIAERDIVELARGVNLQGTLLQSIVLAFDHVVKKYVELIRVPEKPGEENVEKPKA